MIHPMLFILRASILGWAAIVITLSAVNVLSPQRDGPLALSQVFAPYLFVPLFLFAPLLLVRSIGQLARLALVVCALVFVVRFAPGWVAMPQTASASAGFGVTSWNLELGLADPRRVVEGLRTAERGVIGLEELTPQHARAIARDRTLSERFPYRAFHPEEGSLGLGIMSSFPFLEEPEIDIDPPMLTARVDTGDGQRARVVVAHPFRAILGQGRSLRALAQYDPSTRDRQIDAIRASLDQPLAAGEPVILLGDFNVTDREPAYRDLSRGLIDAQMAVGIGPGPTWRPSELEWLPFGLLRIDMVLTGGGAMPLRIDADCTPRGSDHCLVRARVEVPS
jgi:endonuclease/exonuclease/phosphatase family metal-dependent hydrolase